MLELTIQKMNNAAFEDDPREEVVRILREAADQIEYGRNEGSLRDYNGNVVGNYYVEFPSSPSSPAGLDEEE